MLKLIGFYDGKVRLKGESDIAEWYTALSCYKIDDRILRLTFKSNNSKQIVTEEVICKIDKTIILGYFKKKVMNTNHTKTHDVRLPAINDTKLVSHKTVCYRLGMKSNNVHALTDSELKQENLVRIGYYGNTLLYVVL